MSDSSLVSYVIPCYNCENYIHDCLYSLTQQVDCNLEAVVVDDGSCDHSIAKIEAFIQANPQLNIRLYCHPNHENRGVSASRELAVRHAEGEYIAFLDADDVLLSPTKTSEQLSVFQKFPSVVLVHSGITIIGDIPADATSHEHHFSQRSELGVYNLRLLSSSFDLNCIANSTVVVKRAALSNFYYPQLFQVEDFVLWHLLSLEGNFFCIRASLVGYRFHGNSASSSYNKSRLTALYSMLEFKLALSAISPSRVQSLIALLSSFETLSALFTYYATSPLPNRGSTASSYVLSRLSKLSSYAISRLSRRLRY